MSTIPVYRFEYLDRVTRSFKVSEDFATEEAIKQMGGIPIPDSVKQVPADEVAFSGIWRAPKN